MDMSLRFEEIAIQIGNCCCQGINMYLPQGPKFSDFPFSLRGAAPAIFLVKKADIWRNHKKEHTQAQPSLFSVHKREEGVNLHNLSKNQSQT